jgi:hypothetical protein
VRSARSARITAGSSFPSCCRPIHGDGRPPARAAASQAIAGHTRPRPGARLPPCARSAPGRTTPCPATRRVRRANDLAGIPLGLPWSRLLVRVQLMAHGMRSHPIEVHARYWGMAHLMAGRGSPPSVGAGWLFSVWPPQRGTAAPCRTTASSCPFPAILSRTHTRIACKIAREEQPRPLAAHDRCGVRSIGRVGVGAC